MAMQLLAYAHVHSPRHGEDDLNLNLLNRNQPSALEQIDLEAAQELAELEAEAQRGKAAIENRRVARVARVNLIYENAFFIENCSHKNMYPAPKDFIALIESNLGVINFIKDPEISGPAVKTAFTVIKVAAYVYVFPHIKATGVQLIKDYLCQVPVVGPILSNSLRMGLSFINIPNSIAKWAWDPTKYWDQSREIDGDSSLGAYIFNEDGTPQMYETSNREQTKFIGKFYGFVISVMFGPLVIQDVINRINELRATHLLNQDWARTFFSSYFTWKVKRLKSIEARYSIPDVFQNDPILNQPRYRCSQSDQFLIIPFKTPSNTIFQYSVIEDWLLSHHTCPVTQENLQANQLSFDATTYDEIRYRLRAININR